MSDPTTDQSRTGRVRKQSGISRFHRMALREGGISRGEAIKNVQKLIAGLKPTYLDWLESDMSALAVSLDALKVDRVSDEDFTNAYRRACVIRDLGATFGYGAVTDVADSLCELLTRLRANGIRHDGAIETHFRALQIVGSAESDALSHSVDSRLINGLRAISDKFPAAS
jgi:hypothetical protein